MFPVVTKEKIMKEMMKIHLSRNLSREIITWSKRVYRFLDKKYNKGIQMLTKCQEESHVCNIINLKVARQKLFQGHAKSIVASHECFQLIPVVRQLQGSLVIILRIFF